MAYLLGWKDILRPIRDGYRHLFPAPDTGPTPEERRKQRELDRAKGFTYFDTFDQLESWSEADFDILQRANTPFLRRADRRAVRDQKDENGKADVLLIHDYSGNYHDYESAQASGVEEESYTCDYLQYVDTFIYFSHKLVCVPPPTWTNMLHRNGVKVLGTILVEPQTERSERLLEHIIDEDGTHFLMAEKLARIATHYGFDGWLVNIEKPFPKDAWNPDVLEDFLCQLKAALGGQMQLIWYDALTTSNKISYQNALTASNLRFAEACGSMLTNYCWTEADAEKSLQLALSSKILPQNIFFGIDVWAQNKSSFTHPRVTYPEYGGGGTNTGVAVAKLAELGLSAGIFAPAWSFEHFPGHGRDLERAVWQGISLPKGTECSCGDCASRHRPNEELALIKHARERAAGSDTIFYTDLSRAFGTHSRKEKDMFDGKNIHAQLGAQSLIPRPVITRGSVQSILLSHRLENVENSTRLAIEATQHQSIEDENPEQRLPLYELDMTADSILLQMKSRNLLSVTGSTGVCLYYKTTDGIQLFSIPGGDGLLEVVMHSRKPNVRLQELGVHLTGVPTTTVGETVRLLEIQEIRIVTFDVERASQYICAIDNVRVENRGEGESRHTRLCWDFDDTTRSRRRTEGMPYSKITGPFSYFRIRIDESELGRAYALEHVLNKKVIDRLAGRDVEVLLTGIGFDGRNLAEVSIQLCVA